MTKFERLEDKAVQVFCILLGIAAIYEATVNIIALIHRYGSHVVK